VPTRPAAAALLVALLAAVPGGAAGAWDTTASARIAAVVGTGAAAAGRSGVQAAAPGGPTPVALGPTPVVPGAASLALGPTPVTPGAAPAAAGQTSPAAASAAKRTAAQQRVDLPVPEHDPGEVRETTRRVLRRPEFQPAQRSPVQIAWDWLMEQLGILLGLLASGGAGSIVGLVVVLLIMAAVFLLIVRFSRGITRDPAMAAALPAVPRRSGADWRAEAEAHERAGEWRQAVRSRYRALVADLAARGLVDEIPGRTAGEYRGEVRRNVPTAAAEFGDATELFELAWYARWPTGPDDAARLRTLSDQVLTRVPA
jgi:hypothetical protein